MSSVIINGTTVEILGAVQMDGIEGFKVKLETGEIGFIERETLQDSQH